jgi:hypothetical protein
MSGELSRAMNVTYGRSMRLIREENMSFQNKGDLLRMLPQVIILVESLFKNFEGKNKRMIAIAAIEMLINNLVDDPNIKESLHEFLRNDVGNIIDNMVYLTNVGIKYFRRSQFCNFTNKNKSKLKKSI